MAQQLNKSFLVAAEHAVNETNAQKQTSRYSVSNILSLLSCINLHTLYSVAAMECKYLDGSSERLWLAINSWSLMVMLKPVSGQEFIMKHDERLA